jgi:hypothetical protein
LQTFPQLPQLFVSLTMLTSQPSDAIVSQSTHPTLHAVMAQFEALHVDLAWVRAHTFPQPPQLL